jgi:hypothetical protein
MRNVISARERALGAIIQDMADDVERFDGMPVNGALVAEIHANLAAAVCALAEILLTVLPDGN